MRSIACVILCVGAALASSAVPRLGRIVGGEETTIEEFPFMANLQWSNGWFWVQYCGGTLITNRAVLSAAHCFDGNSNLNSWNILLGTDQATSGGDRHTVSRIIMHPKWDADTLTNDVVILHLSVNAVFSDKINRARIAGPNYILADHTKVTLAGWGDTSYFGRPSEQLRKVEVDIINQQYCADQYAFLKTQPGFSRWPDITDDMICTGILNEGGKDACQGDSGGPLVHAGDVIVGIVSWGYRCAEPLYPGVLSRVSYNADWIQNNV